MSQNEPYTSAAEMQVVNVTPPDATPSSLEQLRRHDVDLTWKDVTVRLASDLDAAPLLDRCAGIINGGLIAIMGPSGSGKTTLLNCLAARAGPELRVEGDLRINGEPYTVHRAKKYLGYVLQDDEHNPLLTPRETMQFVADVRLGAKLSAEARRHRIESLLEQLNLNHVADVPVGTGNSGIAAGEKKRLSVALELITLPKVLFLDEPTSNLDSLDALQFIQSMRRLVDERGAIVVCTVHQPQYKVFALFDRLIMLRSGSIIFDDRTRNVVPYCATIEKPCPANVNPADHLMEAIAPERNTSFRTDMRQKAKLLEFYQQPEVDTERGKGRTVLNLRDQPPFIQMLMYSTHRAVLLLQRRRREWLINLFINLINAVLVGTVFLRIGSETSSAAKRNPALFFTVVNQATFGAISTVQLFPSERTVILRIRAAGNLSALPYYITVLGAEMLWKLPFPIIFSIITYFLIGFRDGAEHFFRYFIAIVITFWTGLCVGVMVSTLSRRGPVASLALPLMMELSRLFAGFFAPPALQSPGLRWINYLSYLFYGYSAVAHNEMEGLLLHSCNATVCTYSDAGSQLRTNEMNVSYSESLGIQVAYMFIAATIGYLAVRFFKS